MQTTHNTQLNYYYHHLRKLYGNTYIKYNGYFNLRLIYCLNESANISHFNNKTTTISFIILHFLSVYKLN